MKSNIIAEIRQDFCIFWFRRDLRLEDNTGLNEALSGPYPVLPVFLFDPDILDKLHGPTDKRLDFIHARLQLLKIQFEQRGSTMLVEHLSPIEAFKEFAISGKLKAVYTNQDYEPGYTTEKIRSGSTLCDEMATRIWDLKISQTHARSRFCTGKMPEIL